MKAFTSDRILFEDNHLIIVNKRPGELVQGDRTNDPTLADAVMACLKDRDQKPGNVFLGIPHRLDRPVSGVVIYAKTSKGLSRMNEVFREKTIQKTYWAVCERAPELPEGRLVHYMWKNEKQNKSYVSEAAKTDWKEASLRYRHLASSDRYHLIEVQLETGRHHQIRAQLAHVGCVIKGDLKYGAARSNADGSIHLHSRFTSFIHPVRGDEVQVQAPCPADDPIWAFFERKTGTPDRSHM